MLDMVWTKFPSNSLSLLEIAEIKGGREERGGDFAEAGRKVLGESSVVQGRY